MRTKRILGIMVVSLFLIGLLGACGSRNASDVTAVSTVQVTAVSETVPEKTEQEPKPDMNTGSGSEHPVPQELKIIPQEYFLPADQQGTLVDLYYDTYESFSYTEKSKPLQKHAVVYLPYGYSKDQKYDVFYLMHGGGGDETMTIVVK